MDASGLYSDDYKDQHGSTGEILGDSIVHRGDKSNTPAVNWYLLTVENCWNMYISEYIQEDHARYKWDYDMNKDCNNTNFI